jgi:hypothetical protein
VRSPAAQCNDRSGIIAFGGSIVATIPVVLPAEKAYTDPEMIAGGGNAT